MKQIFSKFTAQANSRVTAPGRTLVTLAGAVLAFGIGFLGDVANAVQGRCAQISEEYRVCIYSSAYPVPVPGRSMPLPTTFVFLEGEYGNPAVLELIKCVEYIFPPNVKNSRRTNCHRDRGQRGFVESFTLEDITPGQPVERVDAVLVLKSGERLEPMRTAITAPSY